MDDDWETSCDNWNSFYSYNENVSRQTVSTNWDDEDDWESSTVPVMTEQQLIARENQRKVEEADAKIAQSLFDDEEEDETLAEIKRKEDKERERKKVVTVKVTKQKRQLSEEEIERRKEQKEEQRLKREAEKKKKAYNARNRDVYGYAEDNECEKYADFEDKYC